MKYFLIVYNRRTGEVDVTEYGENEGALALEERFARELTERHHPEIEIVVLGAPSRGAIERTHARYFKSLRELAQTGIRMLAQPST